MRIKNIKLSFLILGGLMILSFAFFSAAQESSTSDNNVFLDSDQDGLADTEEKTYGTDPLKADTDGDSYSDGAEVKAGYDPTKPAPGDRIVQEEPTPIATEGSTAEKSNLTQEITTKVSSLVNDQAAAGEGDVTMTDIEDVVNESLQAKIQEESLPEINKDEIKVKAQDYDNLPEATQELKKKEDFLSYMVGVSYIVSSNSPKPITSQDDFLSTTDSFGQQITSAIVTQNPAALDSLAASGAKMSDQLKDVEVPEELIDLHVKGLQFSKYAVQLKDSLVPNPEDPMEDVVKFSKMQGLMESIMVFGMEVESKIGQYDITTIEDAKSDLKNSTSDTKAK